MTKKHFECLARKLKALKPFEANESAGHDLFVTRLAYMEQWKCTVESMADFCQEFNPAFDRHRFLAACYRDE